MLASANGQKLFPGTANMRPADEKQKQVHTYGKRWSKAVAPQQTVPLAHKHKEKKGGGGGVPSILQCSHIQMEFNKHLLPFLESFGEGRNTSCKWSADFYCHLVEI